MAKIPPQLRIALDANAVTYLIEALESNFAQPAGSTAAEQVALCRIYIYYCVPYVSPTAERQCLAIRQVAKREKHDSWLSVATCPFGLDLDKRGADRRVLDLFAAHRDTDDCRILVECERYGMDILLTYDREFIEHLGSLAERVRVLRPSELWLQLALPAGAAPRVIPASRTPMGTPSWWRI